MVKLSDRLRRMAECVEPGEAVADIGTDHGLLPIFLYETKRSPRLILCDVNPGPLKRADENVSRFLGGQVLEENRRERGISGTACLERSSSETACLEPSTLGTACLEHRSLKTAHWERNPKDTADLERNRPFCLRLGDGLAPLEAGEVQAVIVAGMGGILISDLLQAAPEKARSFRRLILQPRNHCSELRKWLRDNKFEIYHEFLVREGIYICQVICARPQANLGPSEPFQMAPGLEFEISPIWIRQNDPLLEEFLIRKIAVEQKIIENIRKGASCSGHGSEKRLEALGQPGSKDPSDGREQAAAQNQASLQNRSDLQGQAGSQGRQMGKEKFKLALLRLEQFEELYGKLFGDQAQTEKVGDGQTKSVSGSQTEKISHEQAEGVQTERGEGK